MNCRRSFALLICLSLFTLVGCKKDTPQEVTPVEIAPEPTAVVAEPYGDMLVQAAIGEPLNLIPAIAHDSASHDVASLVYNGLVTADKDLNLKGDLAESWQVSDDGLTIVFNLRKDVKWHDGTPFTARDVLFTYKFMIDEDTPTSYAGDFLAVSSVVALDEYTVEVKYPRPHAPSLVSWSMWIMPAHLLEGVSPTKSSLQRNPIGTGPYIFESWEPNQRLTLKANPDYYEGRPHTERIVFRFLQDQSAAFLELLKGGVDLMDLTPAQYAKQTDTDRFKSQYNTYNYLSSTYAYIGYNLTRKPFDDVRVRKALSYATPRQQIIDSVLYGMGTPATGPYKPGTAWHNPNVATYNYDIEKAKALLAEAGWALNDKGVLTKDKKPFKIELLTNQSTTRVQIAEIVQASWKELGIEVTIRVTEWGAFIKEHVEKRNFDATILAWNIVLDPDPIDVWHSKSCTDKNVLNFICYRNAEADKLMEDALLSFDPAVRKAYYDRFQEILAEEQPYTFLYVPQELVAISSRFKAVEPAAAGLTHNIIDWYVPEDEQKYKNR
ncbi:MAG: peptide-binding protein [Deferribacteraceae bacterium]|jgi:peptide/nickel transport system substrate-binding protein|nr:peptide-binding protein [Deferribacteraceae bacterium]